MARRVCRRLGQRLDHVLEPSNNPTVGSGPFVPDNQTTMSLTYPGATIPSMLSQPAGWSQLVGYDPGCGCFPAGNQAVTSMVPMGDGFAYGLTAPDDPSNGTVQIFTAFGAPSTSSAFGFLQTTTTSTTTSGSTTTTTTVTAQNPVNAVTQIANSSALPGPPEQSDRYSRWSRSVRSSQIPRGIGGTRRRWRWA